jgi:N-acetylmuramoyl-L-alanine amidase
MEGRAVIITTDHWLSTARRVPITGGATMAIRRFLVIHFTAGASAESSIAWWRKLANGVCAHFVIDRDGTIFQCRPCNRTAGHAGSSKWKDPKTGITYHGLNACSIGIELANGGNTYPERFSKLPPTIAPHKNGGPTKEWETYPGAQIAACEMLSKVLCDRYNLDDVVGHDDIAPARKSDPGPAFPMLALREACGFKGLPKR